MPPQKSVQEERVAEKPAPPGLRPGKTGRERRKVLRAGKETARCPHRRDGGCGELPDGA